ncbi:MAG: NB-ARC domain-containing protein, partial [Elainellaceae cyanobacterium]
MTQNSSNDQSVLQGVSARDITATVNQTIINPKGQELRLIYSSPLPDVRHFQGRKGELEDLLGWLGDMAISIVGIRGQGGFGKSTLAAKVFTDSEGFAGKVWIDVRTSTSITSLAGRALKELGVPLEQVQAIPDKDLPGRLLRHLQTGRYLVAIDNMESLLHAEGTWQSGYGAFLQGFQDAGTPSVLLLASREYPPSYFGWRQSRWCEVEKGLAPAEGAALLSALEVEGSDDARETLSAEVQGNPLALSLIAGWVRNEFKAGSRGVARLEQSADLYQITGPHRGESGLSVNSVLGWSLARLGEAQR